MLASGAMSRRPPPSPLPPPRPPVPRWIRAGGEPLFAAGAALAWLDPLARAEEPVGQLWRNRLALNMAAVLARMDGHRVDEGALRDHWLLRRAGDDPGPAGRLYGACRMLAGQGALRDMGRLAAAFDLPAGLPDLPPAGAPVETAAGAAAQVLALGPRYRGLALWLGDAVLARDLGWARPVPLLAAHLRRGDLALKGAAWTRACALAWAQGAAGAADLHADLSRRVARLAEVAPKLRGRDAKAVVARLMAEDALAPEAGERASDRAARRLFARLVELGVVRELTGRPTFRLYGL